MVWIGYLDSGRWSAWRDALISTNKQATPGHLVYYDTRSTSFFHPALRVFSSSKTGSGLHLFGSLVPKSLAWRLTSPLGAAGKDESCRPATPSGLGCGGVLVCRDWAEADMTDFPGLRRSK